MQRKALAGKDQKTTSNDVFTDSAQRAQLAGFVASAQNMLGAFHSFLSPTETRRNVAECSAKS